MTKRTAAAPAKHISAAEAANLVKSGMTLDYGGLSLQPDVFDKALALRAGELSGVKVRAVLSTRAVAIVEADPEGPGLRSNLAQEIGESGEGRSIALVIVGDIRDRAQYVKSRPTSTSPSLGTKPLIG